MPFVEDGEAVVVEDEHASPFLQRAYRITSLLLLLL
jgi:hypothetical protein